MGKSKIADRTEEFKLVREMLSGRTDKRILLIEAPSKQGKSCLLTALAVAASDLGASFWAVAELKYSPTIGEVCDQIGRDLGSSVCQQYGAFKAAPDPTIIVNASLAHARIGRASEITVQPVVPRSGSERAAEALLADFSLLTSPTLLLFDTYEKAGHDLRQWLACHLLPTVRRHNPLCAVIAGVEVPDVNVAWGFCAHCHHLDLIDSAKEWHRYALVRFPWIQLRDLESVLKGLNDPESISNWIERAGRKQPQLLVKDEA